MDNNQEYSHLELPTQKKESVIAPVIEDLRAKSPIGLNGIATKSNEPFSVNFGKINSQGVDNRVQTFDNSTPFLDVYKPLSNGDTVAMYPTYVPRIDNNELLASQQSTGEKWANGTQKFLGKTVNAVVGGTVGIVYGAGSAISDGNFSALYDNKFSNWMNDLDVKMNYQLPNYYTKQEEQAGVFGQLGTANFWADKFLGGLSFTAGAIISEGIWGWATGGTSLATAGTRLGAKISGLARTGKWGVEALGEGALLTAVARNKSIYRDAVAFGKVGEIASIAGRTMRSAGYEASVESLQYKKEAEENFYRNFTELNGREPEAEDIAKFERENESTANTVFASNMAIVGSSNLIGLGHVLNIKNPVNLGIGDFINKKAFGYGINSATKEVTKGTTKQIFARNAFDYVLKPSFTEGLFEEGLQGVTNKTANRWIEHTYNPKYTNENFDQVESFSKSMADQYGSEEGWKENILGMIIGIAGGTVNVRGAQKAKSNELEFEASMNRTYDQSTLQSMILPSRIQMANRIAGFSEDALSEENKGNLIKSHNARIGAITAMVNGKLTVGESIKDMTTDMKTALDALTPEQWAESGVEADQIDTVKAEQLAEFKDVAQSWKTNKQYVQYMVGSKIVGEQDLEDTKLEGIFGSFSKNAQIVEALAYQITIGQNSLKGMQDIQGIYSRELGAENARVLKVVEKLSAEKPEQAKKRNALVQVRFNAGVKRQAILDKIDKLNKAPRETQATDTHKKQILDASTALLEAETKVQESEQQLQAIVTELNATKTYQGEVGGISLATDMITVEDLISLKDNVSKFEGIIEQQRQLNPQKAKYLEDLGSEYNQANDIFLQSLATQKALMSTDKFEIKNIDGWLSRFFKRNGKMAQPTKEWFQEAINTYNDFQKDVMTPLLTSTAEEATNLEKEVEAGEVLQESLQQIADKKDEDLDKTEREVYEKNKDVIDALRAENNKKTKPKSQEQINQEKIDELEAERAQKLAEVQPIVVTESTTTNSVRATELKEGDKFTFNGKEYTVKALNEALNTGGEKVIDNIETEEGRTITNPNTLSKLPLVWFLETTTEQQATIQTEVPNQAEIDKINREYNAKIEALRPTPQDKIAESKKRIEDMLKGIYADLVQDTVDEVASKRPTQAEIEEYRELRKANKENSKRGKELTKILKNWKLMATLTDDGYISIVDLLDNIAQQETEIEKKTTKDEVTDQDIKEVVEDVMTQGSESTDRKEVLNNSAEPVVAKINKDKTKIEFSHLKAKNVVEQIGKDFKIKRKKGLVYEYIDNSNIDNIQIGDVIEIDNMSFEMVENYRLSFDYEQVKNRAPQLNLYVEESQTYLGFTSIYSVFGDKMIKTPSQFGENNINREASLKVKKGDVLTLHVKDTDNWNKSEKGKTEQEFKIYAKDGEGNIVAVLKSGNPKFGAEVDPKYESIRRSAFENWEEAGRPDEMNLGVSIKVSEALLAAPELLFEDGKLVDGEITKEEVENIIIGKGFSKNGKLTIDKTSEFNEDEISTVYLGRLTKNNPNMKLPIVIFKVGGHIVAFPITMTKKSTPIEFDALLQGTSQEMVKAVNQAIIDNNIPTEKLSFSDIALDYRGEVVLSDLAERAKKAFENRTTFTTAEQLANKDYEATNLAEDATIRIALADVDRTFSAPKIVLDLDSKDVKQSKLTNEQKEVNLDAKAATLQSKIYDAVYVTNWDDTFKSTTSNQFAPIIIDGYMYNGKAVIPSRAEGRDKFKYQDKDKVDWTIQRRDKKVLDKALAEIFDITTMKIKASKAEKIQLGAPLIKEMTDYLIERENLAKQMSPKPEDVQNGSEKIC